MSTNCCIRVPKYLRESFGFLNQRNRQVIDHDVELQPQLSKKEKKTFMPPYKMDIKEISISHCENMQEAWELIGTCKELENHDLLLLINIAIDESFDNFNTNELKELAQKCTNKALVIFLTSNIDEKFALLWKLKEINYFYVAMHYSETFEEKDKMLYKFIADFLTKCLSKGHSGIHEEWPLNAEQNEIEMHVLSDFRSYNLLLLAVEENNIDIVKILLALGAEPESHDQEVSAQTIAWNARNSEILLLMAQANLLYPHEIDIDELSEEFKSFYKSTEVLHQAIMLKDNDKVNEVLQRNEHNKLKHYFNLSNKSAAKVALDLRAYDIYETLLINEIYFSPHENEEEEGVFGHLPVKDQRMLRDMHLKHKKDIPDKHINILLARSHAAHDVMDVRGNMKFVKQAYRFLSQDRRFNAILKVVAAARKFEIIYDFNRDAVNVIDPTARNFVEGIFYPMGRIFIGAKQLLNDDTKHQAIAVIAHELCHFAVNLVFENSSNPYYRNNNKMRKKFEKINAMCRQKKNFEDVVCLVYDCYDTGLEHAELIVRIPHMLALYHDHPEQLEKIRSWYPELHDYYEKQLVPAMEKAIPDIEGRYERKMERKVSFLQKIVLFGGILSVFGIILAGIIGASYYTQPIYKFNELSDGNVKIIHESDVWYKGASVKLYDLFADNSTAYQSLTSDHITQLLHGDKLNLSHPYLHYLDTQVRHNWWNMTENLREKLLSSPVTFQNETLMFQSLYENAPNAFNSLTNDEIRNILDGQIFMLSKMIPNQTEFYVERKFPRDMFIELKDVMPNITKNDFDLFFKNDDVTNKIQKFLRQKLIRNGDISKQTKVLYASSYVAAVAELGNDAKKGDYFETYILFTTDEMIDRTAKSRFFILSDEAGAGKTVTFEHMAIESKHKYPNYWVSFIDLKDFVRFYDQHSDSLDILNKILGLLEPKDFEAKIFEDYFKKGRVIILWNGFDEISPFYSDFIVDLMNEIYVNTSNVQFVCTRPVYAPLLEKTFNTKAFSLEEFSEADRAEFLRRYFETQNVTSEGEILEYIQRIEKIARRYEYKTPLMLLILAEVHNDPNLHDFGNLYKIFQKFVAKKTIIWQRKNELNEDITNALVTGDILKLYHKHAILFQYDSIIDVKKLKIMRNQLLNKLKPGEISRMGIFFVNPGKKFVFAHKTFAEFFTSQYLIQNFFLTDVAIENIIMDVIYALQTYRNNDVVIDFVLNFIDAQEPSTSWNPDVSNLIWPMHKNLFFQFLCQGHYIDYVLLFKFFHRDYKLLLDLLHINEKETFYTGMFNPMYKPVYIDNLRPTSTQLKELTQTYLKEDDFSKFLSGRNQKGKIQYGMAWFKFNGFYREHYLYDVGVKTITEEYLMNFYNAGKEELTEMEERELLILLLKFPALKPDDYFRMDFYDRLWEEGEIVLDKDELKSIIPAVLISQSLRGAFNEDSFKEVTDYIIEKAESLLNDSEIFDMFKTHQILHKILVDFSTIENVWEFFKRHTNEKQQKEVLLEKFDQPVNSFVYDFEYKSHHANRHKFNLFHLGVSSDLTPDLMYDVYEEYFNGTEMQSLILKSNEFLVYLMRYGDAYRYEIFTEYLKRLFENDDQILIDFLMRTVDKTDLTIFDYYEQYSGPFKRLLDDITKEKSESGA